MNTPSSRLVRSGHRNLFQRAGSHRVDARRRSRFLTLESLENRSLMAMLVADVLSGSADTAVVGTVYEDLDANGVRNNGENGIQGWSVYLDLDNSGTRNTDAVGALEPAATTNRDGDYTINHLIPGHYRVAEVVADGWMPTAPVSQDVVVTQGRDTQADFFNFSGGDIVGTIWNDLNADGERAADPATGAYTEPGLAGWTVFLDLDNSRTLDDGEPATLTDADGGYSFVGLPPDDYEVTEVLPEGWEVSPTFDTWQTVAVTARQQSVQDYANFSLLNGSIQGVIWNDVNFNGIREIDPETGAFNEPGLDGWTVFLDANSNGAIDAGEVSTLTDANGAYTFVSVPAGDYEVTEVVPDGWYVSPTFDSRQTVGVSGGAASTAEDFANFTVLNGSIHGTIWNDLNRNSLRDVSTVTGLLLDPGLADWTVFLDLNRNRIADSGEPSAQTDALGEYVFADLQVGEYEVQEVLPAGWETATTFSDSYSVIVFSGVESRAPDFANFDVAAAAPGSVTGVVWNDMNGNGVRDAGDAGLAGRTVFIDQNFDGALTVGEPQAASAADGAYSISGISSGTVSIVVQSVVGWRATAPMSNSRTIALRSGEIAVGLDFGEAELKDSSIRGVVFADSDQDRLRDAGERGLGGITVYLDLNNNSQLDTDEPRVESSTDLYYTPGTDEAGSYSFTHLARGNYAVRQIVPAALNATPLGEREHLLTITAAEDRAGVDFADVFRANEIHGVRFDDANQNHVRDAGEAGIGGTTIFVDLDRDNVLDLNEPTTVTRDDGSYSFTTLSPGAYVIREIVPTGRTQTTPATTGGILWPAGVSNPAVGNVSPASITTSLASGETYRRTVSLTLPNSGALTNLVDVFLLFDDTGSFVNNSPIVRGAFPSIISQLQTSLPGIDLGFGVGRLEEYGNFAYEYATGRPFILNQPIVAAGSAGYMAAIQAALDRTTPGYGGDQPETDIEALFQLVTGRGFDGNNNGSVSDSGPAGLASTQLNPGDSGDVPSFASFVADPANSVMPAAGNVGGAGFRAGALPIILLATDTGFAYQPQGETVITGLGGVTLPISALSETSRPTTPFNSGSGIQQTVTGLNALGALVIGLGTNPQASLDPRQGLESLSKLTGATNHSTTTIANGTADPIAPGDPLYFQIASGFAASVADGVVSAIQNAVTNVAVDIDVQASDPRVRTINHTGALRGVGAGGTASFDIEFVGDGVPHRFDLQFVRAGTNVVLGSIPVVIGTPIPGDGYEFDDLEAGEIEYEDNFGDHSSAMSVPVFAPTSNGVRFSLSESAAIANVLNLYDYRNAAGQSVLGAADVQLVGAKSGTIAGSLIIKPGDADFVYVTSNGVLPPDSYTLTLRSAADGFQTAAGNPLDGDADGVAGGDLVRAFAVSAPAANAVTVSLPNFSRGPEQAVNVPADTTLGLPISVSNGDQISTLSFVLEFDAGLLNVTDVTLPASAPSGSTAQLTLLGAGRVQVSLTFGSPLPAGSQAIAYLNANVPAAAATRYGEREVLDLSAIQITNAASQSIPTVDDDAVHVNAYFGDLGRNGRYDSFDVQQASRLAVRLDTGFQQHPLLDPVIIGDFNGNNRIDSFDVQRLSRLALRLSVAEAPSLPSPPPTTIDTDRLIAVEPTALKAASANAPSPATATLRSDIDGNGAVDAQDVLWAIYYFNRSANSDAAPEATSQKLDINGDLQFDSADILLAITDVDVQSRVTEGEFSAAGGLSDTADDLDGLASLLAEDLVAARKKK